MTTKEMAHLSIAFTVLCALLSVRPFPGEPVRKVAVDAPQAKELLFGTAVIQFRSGSVRIAPVFGPDALSFIPPVGHLHVSVNDAPWVWAHTSAAPVVVAGLPEGHHKFRIRLVAANHEPLAEDEVSFTVPEARPHPPASASGTTQVAGALHRSQPDRLGNALIIDSPLPEALSRGVVFLRYRTSSRGGHIHVTVNKASWFWSDPSGNPVILQGLGQGHHKIKISQVDDSEHVIDHRMVECIVPSTNAGRDKNSNQTSYLIRRIRNETVK